MENSRFKTIGLVLGILVLLAAGWWMKVNYINRPTLITVVGEGRVSVKPEMVRFVANVTNSADRATFAVAENKRLTRDAISMIKGVGVSEQDIVVSYVRVLPPGATTGLTTYQAVNTISVTLKDLSQFDNLVTSLYATGAQSISNIVFTTQDSKAVEKEAVAKAIQDAQARVKEIAKASRKRVGRMVSIQAVERGEAGALAGEAPREAGFAGIISASPSQIEIVRQATIVFELR